MESKASSGQPRGERMMDYVFWPAATRVHGYRDHVAAAVAGGFTHLAIDPVVYARCRAEGLSAADIVAVAADQGVTLSHLDTVTDWAPQRVPGEVNQQLRDRFDVTADVCFEISDRLGLTTMLAVAGYDPGAVPQDRLIAGFAGLADRAAAAGLHVDLEFMPFWGLPNLADAWAIVREADRPNTGLMIDTWHFARGAYDPDLLRSIPARFLGAAQVSDATAAIRGASLFDDTVRFRRFPNEGELPVIETLAILIEKGLREVGPEVFSDEADALPPEEAGRRCGHGLRAVLAAAGSPFNGPIPPACT